MSFIFDLKIKCNQSFCPNKYLVRHRCDATGGHVGATHCFDFLHRLKLLVIEDLVEVDYNLVKEPETLETLLVDVVLVVELLVVGDLREHDGNVFVAFAVQLLTEDR